jgi:hypothetical protein
MSDFSQVRISYLLAHPEELLVKPPFTRGVITGGFPDFHHSEVYATESVRVGLPALKYQTIPQEQYVSELNVYSHEVLFDENVPSITIKAKKGGFLELKQYRIAIPFQQIILEKQVRHLCVNRMVQNLENTEATEKQKAQFVRIKQEWLKKNMEGAKTQFVKDQKSFGDAGLLFFMSDGKLCTKNIKFTDGYVIITHKDNAGKHILECLYYAVDNIEYIDAYDKEYLTRYSNGAPQYDENTGAKISDWSVISREKHGFSEIPLITKRGPVAWDNGQPTIESYEALYNTFIVIQKRHGWGMLYVKGKFTDKAKRLAGNVILNDTSGDPNADAKMLNPPDPANMTDTLDFMEYSIQKACGTTFILPKDINLSGDASGLAVELTQELDMATAQDGVIEWQNVANKMMRLFIEGLAQELVNSGDAEYRNAVTEFKELNISNEFSVWKPKSEEAFNQMLATLHGAGGISDQTFIEKNTISTPDEVAQVRRETEQKAADEMTKLAQTTEIQNKYKNTTTDNNNNNK